MHTPGQPGALRGRRHAMSNCCRPHCRHKKSRTRRLFLRTTNPGLELSPGQAVRSAQGFDRAAQPAFLASCKILVDQTTCCVAINNRFAGLESLIGSSLVAFGDRSADFLEQGTKTRTLSRIALTRVFGLAGAFFGLRGVGHERHPIQKVKPANFKAKSAQVKSFEVNIE